MVAQQARDQRDVHGVAGAIGDHAAQDAVAEQRQVSDQVQHLVADELIVIAQGAVGDAVACEHDGVFFRGAADQSHLAHLLRLMQKSEGARGGDVAAVEIAVEVGDASRGARHQLDLKTFFADQRMRKIDGVGDGVSVGRVEGDELVAVAHLHFFEDAPVDALAPLRLQSGAQHHLHERLRAAIEDGQLQVVELDDGIVHAQADERREQVLGGGDEHALLHQASGVADLGHVAADCLHLKAFQIDAAEKNARSGRRRQNAQAHGSAAVQADAAASHWLPDCLFEFHACGLGLPPLSMFKTTSIEAGPAVANKAQSSVAAKPQTCGELGTVSGLGSGGFRTEASQEKRPGYFFCESLTAAG